MPLQWPTVNKCCCCIPLKIGVLIIGYVTILTSCLTIAGVCFGIYLLATYVEDNNGVIIANSTTPRPEELEKSSLNLYISFAYYIFVFLFNMTINIVLVTGVHMRKPSYLRFYFRATFVLFALGLALAVVTAVFMSLFAAAGLLKWCFTLFICLVIVRSYCLELEEQEKRPAYEMQPYMPVQQATPMA